MKKIHIIVAFVCLIISMVISIQSPINISHSFVLNGNALSEDIGFEKEVGADYKSNKFVIENIDSEMTERVSNAITKQSKEQGVGVSLDIPKLELKENKAINIGIEDEYIEPKPSTQKTEHKNTETNKETINEHKSNIVNNFEIDAENVIFLGKFKLTAYCPCYGCSEGYGTNTASGRKATANHTIAVDPKVIPYGTKVIIERDGVFYEYIAEDCGGAIKNKKIDIYFNSHSDTTKFGVRYGNVYIVK